MRPEDADVTVIPGPPATASLRLLLTELGESGRTGALHIGGTPGGVLYLISGRIDAMTSTRLVDLRSGTTHEF